MRSSDPSDPELLAEWLDHQREPAFRSLVARYAGLVHMTAKRTCGDDSLATEATQLTFIALARKAKSLAALSGKDREALLLRFYQSLTIREVAEALGIATDAAQKRIDRATERGSRQTPKPHFPSPF